MHQYTKALKDAEFKPEDELVAEVKKGEIKLNKSK